MSDENHVDGKKVIIYTDGACSGNPGPGGIGVIITTYIGDRAVSTHYSVGYKHTTNNRMELRAVLFALYHTNRKDHVTIVTDSTYVSKAINSGWLDSWKKNNWKTADKKPVKNRDLWEEYSRISEGRDITIRWTRGHVGTLNNEMCDDLAVRAYHQKECDLIDDEGFLS